MKTYLITLLTLLSSWGALALLEREAPFGTESSGIMPQPLDADMTFCHPIAGDMRALFNDPEFLALHPSPKPAQPAYTGNRIRFAAEGGEAQGYYLEAEKPSALWLFVYQEWWGLNANIMEEAEKLHRDLGGQVHVLAVDMYDGEVTDQPQEARVLMSGRKEERLQAIVRGAAAYAGPGAKIAHLGWCFGGAWSLKASLLTAEQTVGTVMYYGMPVRDVEALRALNNDVLGLFATETAISQEVIEDFAAKMQEADKGLDYTIYDAVHGFANPSNPRFDPEATADAYAKALDYLKNTFGLS
ncbi:MAG: dienelactone hydrolase family protein [Nitritalea sp.]